MGIAIFSVFGFVFYKNRKDDFFLFEIISEKNVRLV